MYTKFQRNCVPFTANDGCQVQELLHPAKDPVDPPYSLALCRVAPDSATYKHRLRQSEVYLIMEGTGLAHIGDEQVRLGPRDAVLIPADRPQWIENTGCTDLVFAAICSPAWRAEDDLRL